MSNILDNYPGSKSASGIPQWLINNMPLHSRYFELYAGSAQLYRIKRPAAVSILSDKDPITFNALRSVIDGNNTLLFNRPALSILQQWSTAAMFGFYHLVRFDNNDFIYLDPPYPKTARRAGKAYYKCEMLDDFDHVQLLETIRDLPAKVMISTRQNQLYDQVLHDWRKDTFQTADRGGPCEEVIYMNYAVPDLLHQYDYVGLGFTDRQRIKRKISRFSDKLEQLPLYEKHLFIQELIRNDAPAVQHFLTMAGIENKTQGGTQ